jgi:hypothetical protein
LVAAESFNGLEKARVKAFADFSRASTEVISLHGPLLKQDGRSRTVSKFQILRPLSITVHQAAFSTFLCNLHPKRL